MGSPSAVPVPWASTASTCAAVRPGRRQGAADDALLRGAARGGQAVGGAVLVDALPRSTARTPVALAARLREAFQDGLRRRPSAQPVPSAVEEKAL